MNTIVKTKEVFSRIKSILEYTVVLAIILDCNSLFVHRSATSNYTDMSLFFQRLVIILLIVDIVLFFFQNKFDKSLLRRPIIVIVALYICSGVFYLVNVLRLSPDWARRDFIKDFFILLPLMILWLWTLYMEHRPFDVFFMHSDIICVYTGAGLILYLASIFHRNTVFSDTVYSNWSALANITVRANFLNLTTVFRGNFWQIFNIPLLRNHGMFTEPLMYAIPMLTALFTEMFLRDRKDQLRLWKWILLSAGLFTCQATLGLMIMMLAWVLKGIEICVRRKKYIMLLPLIVVLILFIGVFYHEKNQYRYEESGRGSINSHVDDLKMGMRAFLNKPLTGGGFENDDYVRQFMSEIRMERDRGFSNSVTIILGHGGLMLGIICILPFILCLLKITKRDERSIALWSVGPLAIFTVVIFYYRMFMLLLFAFGYSLLCRTPDRLTAKEESEELIENASGSFSGTAETAKPHIGSRPIVALYVGCGGLLIAFGDPLWMFLHKVLRENQWSLSLSQVKAFCLAVIVAANLVLCADALWKMWTDNETKRKTGWNRILALIFTDAVYLLLYKMMYSVVNTMLSMKHVWTDVREGMLLLIAWFLFYIFISLAVMYIRKMTDEFRECREHKERLTPQVKADLKKGFIVLAAVSLLAICMGSLWSVAMVRGVRAISGKIAAAKPLTDSASGRVYANDVPYIFHYGNSRISLPGTREGGFDVCKNASVLCGPDADYRELFDAGFMVTKLSDDLIAYSNDRAVIDGLSTDGYQWYRYFPYEHVAQWTLKDGRYKALFSLSLDRQSYTEMPDDTVIGNASVSRLISVAYDMGEKNLRTQEITLGDFAADGTVSFEVPFSLDRITEGMLYKFTPSEGAAVDLKGISLVEDPDSIVIKTTDIFGNVIREEYYNTDGSPIMNNNEYAAVECEYDLRGRLYSKRYFDADGEKCRLHAGYHSLRYSYNRQGSTLQEQYYDEQGKKVMIYAGYSALRYEYNSKGQREFIRYVDTEGNPVINSSGIASIRREYNAEGQVEREEYYDDLGNRVCNSSGISVILLQYDDNKRVSEERYLDEEDRPCADTSGIFGIHYERDANGRSLYDTYLDAAGDPMTCSDGYYGIRYEYDPLGNKVALSYVDDKGEPMISKALIASIRREYDDHNRMIRERYYDTAGQPTINSSGVGGYDRKYDDLSHPVEEIYVDTNDVITENRSGIAGLVRVYDDINRNCREEYYDAEGARVLNASGISAIEREYDEFKRTTLATYLGVEDESVSNTAGVAAEGYAYDKNWRTAEIWYYDSDGVPVCNTSGYAGISRDYERRRIIAENYLDIEGNPVMINAGYATQKRGYDDAGNQIETTYVDLSGNPVKNSSGIAIIRREFDEVRNCVYEAYFDEKGFPCNNNYGISIIRRTFDADRKVTKEEHFDSEGKAAP